LVGLGQGPRRRSPIPRERNAAGYRSNGEPGERPRYHSGYCAAYVLDPDGNNIEVVNHHGSETRST
jgi:hypothetical protein